MAGSPISRESQYADEVLAREVLAPQIQVLYDATTYAAKTSQYFSTPVQGRITKIKAVTETALGTAASSIAIWPLAGYFGVSGDNTVSMSLSSPGVVTLANHNLVPGQAVAFTAGGHTLPTGITASIPVYVSYKGWTTSTFQVANTQAYALAGTNSVNFTANGDVGALFTPYVLLPNYSGSPADNYYNGNASAATIAAALAAGTTLATLITAPTSSVGSPTSTAQFNNTYWAAGTAVGDIVMQKYRSDGLQGGFLMAADTVLYAVTTTSSGTGAVRLEIAVEPTYN